jgi:hypothetical protein
MAKKLKRRVRKMYDWEIAEAQNAFGNSLNYDRVRICEGYGIADFTDRIGRFLKRQPPLGPGEHNSITLRNRCYFPVYLPENKPEANSVDVSNVEWLMHELTHTWQYQHTGIRYLFRALWAQLLHGDAAYDFGGPSNLVALRDGGGTILDFNPEAQADIVQTYYSNAHASLDVSAYLPYLQDIQNT